MSGVTIATCVWRALDREGEDKCRLAKVEHGWLLIGHARFRDEMGFAALDYSVRIDADWHTLGADIAGLHGDHDVSLRIERGRVGWIVNGVAQTGLEAACDLDLSFTPATNLMPLRRLMASDAPHIKVQAGWLRYPQAALQPLDQTYEQTGARISYASKQTGFSTELEVDETGFVSLYPGLWEGEVTHAA